MLLYTLLVAALIPQIVVLAATLPERAVVGHWKLAWGGFSVLVAVGLIATAVCLTRGSPWTVVAASATSAVLFVDAWFDLMTRQGPTEMSASAARVLLLKLPLGALCLFASVAVIRRLYAGRALLARAGLGWRGATLVAMRAPDPADPVAVRVAAACAEPAAIAAGRVKPRLVAPWVIRVYLIAALAALLSLVFVTRHPSVALATNWTLAWVGFDVLVAIAFAVTVLAAWLRSPVAIAALAADAAILLCDGWFDTMTAHGRVEIAVAVASAIGVELPLAVFSLLIARRAVRRIASARAVLARADAPVTPAGAGSSDPRRAAGARLPYPPGR